MRAERDADKNKRADPAAAERRARSMARLRRRRVRWWLWRGTAVVLMLTVALAAHWSSDREPFFAAAAAPLELADAAADRALEPARLAGAIVRADVRPSPRPPRPAVPVKMVGNWWRARTTRAEPGESVPVSLTAYCLKGTTRRDNYVRQGIVASDPRVFPLGRYVEVYIGDNYLGRFLVDDTGGVIKGAILDIWTPTCREAVLFGRRKGTAILVPKNAEPAPTPDVTALMPYVRKKRTGVIPPADTTRVSMLPPPIASVTAPPTAIP